MNKLFLVFIGGGTGSVFRHFIAISFTSMDKVLFPFATFIANLVGCLIIGLLVGKVNLNKKANLIFVTGFCGGFTTFSTFSKESIFLFQNHLWIATFYIALSIFLGILLVWLGYSFSSRKNTSPY